MGRIRTSLAIAALLSGGLIASPAQATIDIRDNWSDAFSDSFSDCGIDQIDLDFTGHGTFTGRADKSSEGQTWFGHNQYWVQETYSNPATGRSFSLTLNGNWREIRGTQLEGSVWQFDWKDSGATWVFRDGDGNVVWRDRGTVSGTDIIDVLDDSEIGGVYLSSEVTSLRGQFKEFDWCEDMVLPYLG